MKGGRPWNIGVASCHCHSSFIRGRFSRMTDEMTRWDTPMLYFQKSPERSLRRNSRGRTERSRVRELNSRGLRLDPFLVFGFLAEGPLTVTCASFCC